MCPSGGVAGGAGFDRAHHLMMREVIEREFLRVQLRSTTRNRGDDFHPEGLREHHILVAAISRIGGHLIGQQIVRGELFQHRSDGVRVIRAGRLGDRADD